MTPRPTRTRREVLCALLAATAVISTAVPAMAQADISTLSTATTQTMEAFADTVVPGRKRSSRDRAIAGADSSAGAVEAGALALLLAPQLDIAGLVDGIAVDLNAHAVSYALKHLILLDPTVPPFVALSFGHRSALLRQLCDPRGLDQQLWAVLVFLVHLAFNSAAHLHTAAAVADHPGLNWIGFPRPAATGVWTFPAFSYGRQLASPHPATTATGSPP